MSPRVAIVTGSNKGIGLAVVKSLCEKFEGDVFLTARNKDLGTKAVAELEKVRSENNWEMCKETYYFYS